MIRRPPRSTLDRSSAASDVYKRQRDGGGAGVCAVAEVALGAVRVVGDWAGVEAGCGLSLIHISEPTRPY